MRSKVLTSIVVALTLLGVTACSSDKKASPATSTASDDTLGTGVDDTGVADTGANGASDDSTADTTPVVTAVGSDAEMRTQIVAQVMKFGPQASYTFDEACVTKIVAQLSAADLQAFRENFDNPTLSTEGDALGNKILECDTGATTTTT